MNGWTGVISEDGAFTQMPPCGVEVLVWLTHRWDSVVETGSCPRIAEWCGNAWICPDEGVTINGKITHWQPLPEGPALK